MRTFINRMTRLKSVFKQFPCVAILGPRQCGKSTLAKHFLSTLKQNIYLDLEKRSDRNKVMHDPELFFNRNRESIICLDEIQYAPELFSVLRSEIDERESAGQFLILGSASPDLLRQSSESLAGRIVYIELCPFSLLEVGANHQFELWVKGGFPDSFLTQTDQESMLWRMQYIKTFLERDIPQFGFRIPSRQIERFWMMLAHLNGQCLNRSKLGGALGVTHNTIQSYIDILDQTFMIRVLQPYEKNIKKRLVKSPKIYFRDTGILHALLQIDNEVALFGHPVYGSSWEGFVVEQLIRHYPNYRPFFVRAEKGAEIDLILEKGTHRFGVECKASTSPSVSVATKRLARDLDCEHLYIVAPIKEPYPIEAHISVTNIESMLKQVSR